MRIALLGGAGRVGTWIAPRLADDHEVTVLDVAAGDGVVAVDALDQTALAEAFAGHDAVIHLCAVVPRGDETLDPERVAQAWAVNVGSVAQALLACRDSGVARFVHMSSLSVFSTAGVELLAPESPTDSLQPYGLSKRIAERTCADLAGQLGVDAVSVRVGWPTPDHLAPLWLQPLSGEAIEVRRADGGVIPAISGRQLAEALLSELARDPVPGHRAIAVVADHGAVFSD